MFKKILLVVVLWMFPVIAAYSSGFFGGGGFSGGTVTTKISESYAAPVCIELNPTSPTSGGKAYYCTRGQNASGANYHLNAGIAINCEMTSTGWIKRSAAGGGSCFNFGMAYSGDIVWEYIQNSASAAGTTYVDADFTRLCECVDMLALKTLFDSTVMINVADVGLYTVGLDLVQGDIQFDLSTNGIQGASTAISTSQVRFNSSGGVLANSVKSNTYLTGDNCSSSASPAVCAAAAAGSVTIAAAATAITVNTTAVTANSQIFVMEDSSLGTKLGVTCNTNVFTGSVTARTAATSFTYTVSAAPAANPACFSYFIVN